MTILRARLQKRHYCRIKRAIDVVVSTSLLLLLAPLMLAIAILIRFNLGAPVLFRHERPGLHGRSFTLVKFRTMSNALDENGVHVPDVDRLSRFGRWLRASSLDELPELWNVVRGNMSLVGPRPLLKEYLPLYSDSQRRRHEMKPGLTGWAQVNGRNRMSWVERFELDVWYIDNWSVSLDLRILVRTVRKVLQREGIAADGQATMTRFTGNVE